MIWYNVIKSKVPSSTENKNHEKVVPRVNVSDKPTRGFLNITKIFYADLAIPEDF